MTPFKEKYVEGYGSPAKNWEKVSRRVRGRLNLEAKFIMETYVGKQDKPCKRQNEAGMIFAVLKISNL